MRIRVVAVAAATVALAAACSSSSTPQASNTSSSSPSSSTSSSPAGPPAHPTKLLGDVGHNDAFAISLKDPQGKAITNIAAGTYTLDVNDESTIHSFDIQGTGVSDHTDIGTVSKRTFTVTLTPGTYTFFCDAHPSEMRGTFQVT